MIALPKDTHPDGFAYTVALPSPYRPADILAFHARDPLRTAERVTAVSMEKGITWDDAPALLRVAFGHGRADARLNVDGGADPLSRPRFEAMVRRLLGLTEDVEAFEARHRDHPEMGRLIAARPGLRIPVTPTPFEGLTWAVSAQQISVIAALSLRRRLVQAVGLRHSGGLLCYPGPRQIGALSPEALRAAGFSGTKARTLLTLSELAASGELPLDEWAMDPPAEAIRAALHAVRGVGPWTVEYTLLRGFAFMDGSLHGDGGVLRGLKTLLHSDDKITPDRAKVWLDQFAPWRALAAGHVWAMQSA